MARNWGKMVKPLTPEEKKFAEQHHTLVFRYLEIFGLPANDWYDVVIFGYFRAVRDWLSMPRLHNYKFSTIAFKDMGSSVYEERNMQNRWWLDFASLDAPVFDSSDDLFLVDTVTEDNLRYTHYVEEYEEPALLGNTISEECRAVLDFLKSGTSGVHFCFKSKEKADTKAESLRRFRARYNMQKVYNVFREECTVYAAPGPQFSRLEAFR